jgi:hypothetical protein
MVSINDSDASRTYRVRGRYAFNTVSSAIGFGSRYQSFYYFRFARTMRVLKSSVLIYAIYIICAYVCVYERVVYFKIRRILSLTRYDLFALWYYNDATARTAVSRARAVSRFFGARGKLIRGPFDHNNKTR